MGARTVGAVQAATPATEGKISAAKVDLAATGTTSSTTPPAVTTVENGKGAKQQATKDQKDDIAPATGVFTDPLAAVETAPVAKISTASIPSCAGTSTDEEKVAVDGANDGEDSQVDNDGFVIDGRVKISGRDTSSTKGTSRSDDFPRNDEAIAGDTTSDDDARADAGRDEEGLIIGEIRGVVSVVYS